MKNKGFISSYFLTILIVVLTVLSLLIERTNRYLNYCKEIKSFRKMNNIEVLLIKKIIDDFNNVCEEDESFVYDGVSIQITYDNLTACIIMVENGTIRERILDYNETTGLVKSYR